jgi:hypothetical protein
MTDSAAGPSATVVPLRPPTTPPARGWHGMKARSQKSYTPEDWKRWGELGGDAWLVNIERGSPAWLADVRTGAWVLSINGQSYDTFERAGAAVGAAISVKAFYPGLGVFDRTLPLIEPPSKTSAPKPNRMPPAWKREPAVLPGERVFKDSRPAFLELAARHPHVRRHVWLLAELLKREWRKGIVIRHNTIAKAAGCDVSTVGRAQTICVHFGFLSVESGKRKHRSNSFTVCWPSGTR